MTIKILNIPQERIFTIDGQNPSAGHDLLIAIENRGDILLSYGSKSNPSNRNIKEEVLVPSTRLGYGGSGGGQHVSIIFTQAQIDAGEHEAFMAIGSNGQSRTIIMFIKASDLDSNPNFSTIVGKKDKISNTNPDLIITEEGAYYVVERDFLNNDLEAYAREHLNYHGRAITPDAILYELLRQNGKVQEAGLVADKATQDCILALYVANDADFEAKLISTDKAIMALPQVVSYKAMVKGIEKHTVQRRKYNEDFDKVASDESSLNIRKRIRHHKTRVENLTNASVEVEPRPRSARHEFLADLDVEPAKTTAPPTLTPTDEPITETPPIEE